MENKQPAKTTHLLQIAVVCLAIVSFFTTANGMKEYIFSNNSVIAYTASAAIQGILLALSMNLPGYLRGIWGKGWNVFARFMLCLLAVLLTGVAVFCSSWFSYVYIAQVIHHDSWDADSELLVQQAYREELYAARDYARAYRIYLEESLGGDILLLEDQAKKLSDSMVDFGLDWDEETTAYVTNGGAAASYMAPAINAMREAARNTSSQETRDLAAKAVADARESINERMMSIQQRLVSLENSIAGYNSQIATLTSRINNATEGTDVASLTNSINTFSEMISSLTQQQAELQMQDTQLDRALSQLQVYENFLGLNSSTSAISIRSALVNMQSEFFKQNPDEEVMLDIATTIFESLRNTANSSGTTGEGNFSYTDLLIQMNQLIHNLVDYSEVKAIEADLEQLIMELRTEDPGSDSPETPDPTAPRESADPSATADPAETETPAQPTESTGLSESVQSEPSSSPESMESSFPPVGDEQNSGDRWQEEWESRLNQLKSQVSAMPAYSGSDYVGDKTSGVLSEFQVDILRSYDRNRASRTLDDMIRRYISNHSAIYQGIIYLQSPYRSLAIFALLLALAFDLTGFVFGVIIEGNPRQEGNMGNGLAVNVPFFGGMTAATKGGSAPWTILETQEQYMVLTGDYESRDGKYYYKAFKDGKRYEWLVEDTPPYPMQIYVQDKAVLSKGAPVVAGQALCFASQANGPKDGIYTDCVLIFDEGSLILIQNNQPGFLSTIDEYAPVHSYDPKKGENQTIPAKQLATRNIKAKTAVVALNAKGTRIAAIYVIEA